MHPHRRGALRRRSLLRSSYVAQAGQAENADNGILGVPRPCHQGNDSCPRSTRRKADSGATPSRRKGRASSRLAASPTPPFAGSSVRWLHGRHPATSRPRRSHTEITETAENGMSRVPTPPRQRHGIHPRSHTKNAILGGRRPAAGTAWKPPPFGSASGQTETRQRSVSLRQAQRTQRMALPGMGGVRSSALGVQYSEFDVPGPPVPALGAADGPSAPGNQ